MASPSVQSPALIGVLKANYTACALQDASPEQDVFAAELDEMSLHLNETLLVGRCPQNCHWSFDDPTVSGTHLKLYSVCYDEEATSEPLVFAQDLSSNGTLWNGRYLGRGHSPVVLSNGDSLKLNDRIILTWKSKPEEDFALFFSPAHQKEIESFSSSFTVSTKQIGAGGFGKVLVATKTATKKQFACKMIAIPNQMAGVAVIGAELVGRGKSRSNEVDILRDLRHPNIINIEKIYCATNAIYIMQDLLAGGDLFSYCLDIGSEAKLPEHMVGLIVKQILEGVKHLHERDIVHRDIKPENVLLSNRSLTPRVVLADFGAAKRLVPSHGQRMTSTSGTFGYMAPEIWGSGRSGYTKAVDLWSVGVLTFSISVGSTPFDGGNSHDLPESKTAEFADACRELWSRADHVDVSSRLRDFVKKLLVVDESRRMNVDECLAHHWFHNRSNRAAFDAAYRVAISDWRPAPVWDIVEEISPA